MTHDPHGDDRGRRDDDPADPFFNPSPQDTTRTWWAVDRILDVELPAITGKLREVEERLGASVDTIRSLERRVGHLRLFAALLLVTTLVAGAGTVAGLAHPRSLISPTASEARQAREEARRAAEVAATVRSEAESARRDVSGSIEEIRRSLAEKVTTRRLVVLDAEGEPAATIIGSTLTADNVVIRDESGNRVGLLGNLRYIDALLGTRKDLVANPPRNLQAIGLMIRNADSEYADVLPTEARDRLGQLLGVGPIFSTIPAEGQAASDAGVKDLSRDGKQPGVIPDAGGFQLR